MLSWKYVSVIEIVFFEILAVLHVKFLNDSGLALFTSI